MIGHIKTIFVSLVLIFITCSCVSPTVAQESPLIITSENSHRLGQTGWFSRGTIGEIQWLPDGSGIAITASTGIWLLDMESANNELQLVSTDGTHVLIGPDHQLLIAIELGEELSLWNVTQNEEYARIPLHIHPIRCIALSTDGTLVAIGGKYGYSNYNTYNIQLSNLTTNEEPLITNELDGFVTELVFNEDGSFLFSGASDSTVRIWDTATGIEHTSLEMGAQVHHVVRIPRTDMIAAGGHADGSGYRDPAALVVWEPSSDARTPLLEDPISDIATSTDGNMLAACSGERLHLWDVATLQKQQSDIGTVTCQTIAFDPQNTVLAVNSGASITIIDYNSLETLATINGFNYSVLDLAISSDNALLAAGEFRIVQIFDAQNLTHLRTLTNVDIETGSLAFNPDNTLLAAGGIHTNWSGMFRVTSVRVWDISNFEPVVVLLTDRALERKVAFNHDGRLLAATTGQGQLRTWTVDPYTEYGLLEWVECTSIAFSPVEDRLACGHSDGTIQVWDIRLWDYNFGSPHETVLAGHNAPIIDLVFSPNGNYLASASKDGSLRLWNLTMDTSQIIQQIELPEYAIIHSPLAFSPDSTILATGFTTVERFSSFPISYPVRLIDTATGEEFASLEHHAWITSIIFNPDGTAIITSAADGGIRLWSIE